MCLQKICGLINRLILLVNVDGLPTIKHTYKRGEVMTEKTLSYPGAVPLWLITDSSSSRKMVEGA